MAYRYSQIDDRNIQWMANDNTRASLCRAALKEGKLRGLGKFDVTFKYPIAAIAGENGSGKSTFLALVACGFHNKGNGFKLPDRKNAYYTFSDFFVQAKAELPPQGIKIDYQIRHNRWRNAEPGLGWQERKKGNGGKWNDYATRVKRNVIYFGIQRVVPHYERSAHKSYRSRFIPGTFNEISRNRIRDIAGRIIGKNYTSFNVHKHSKYSLPIATCGAVEYSGFNMGAGESAVFEILTALFEAGSGSLLVIDEIELGLHEKAQHRLINELKQLCYELKCQIICSTHSHVILNALPPEGRFFVESGTDESKIIPEISADWACGKLRGLNSGELDVFVEDGVAQALLSMWLPRNIRNRINVIPIGSSEAVLRQLTSRYLEKNNNCLALLDGDKSGENNASKSKLANYAEASTPEKRAAAIEWATERLSYLPSTDWPEKWLIDMAKFQVEIIGGDQPPTLINDWGLDDEGQLSTALEEALRAGKHNEFIQLASEMEQSEEQVRSDIIRFVKHHFSDSLNNVILRINQLLEASV